MLHVVGVERDPFAVAQVGTAAHLPGPGDAGAHAAVQRCVEAIVLLQFLAHDGARPDQAHVTHEHVPELGQLVQAGLADEAAELGDAGVVLELERGIPLGFGGRVGL